MWDGRGRNTVGWMGGGISRRCLPAMRAMASLRQRCDGQHKATSALNPEITKHVTSLASQSQRIDGRGLGVRPSMVQGGAGADEGPWVLLWLLGRNSEDRDRAAAYGQRVGTGIYSLHVPLWHIVPSFTPSDRLTLFHLWDVTGGSFVDTLYRHQ
jgi:hypothetical protein